MSKLFVNKMPDGKYQGGGRSGCTVDDINEARVFNGSGPASNSANRYWNDGVYGSKAYKREEIKQVPVLVIEEARADEMLSKLKDNA